MAINLATTTTGILVADHPGSPMLEVSKVGDLDISSLVLDYLIQGFMSLIRSNEVLVLDFINYELIFVLSE